MDGEDKSDYMTFTLFLDASNCVQKSWMCSTSNLISLNFVGSIDTYKVGPYNRYKWCYTVIPYKWPKRTGVLLGWNFTPWGPTYNWLGLGPFPAVNSPWTRAINSHWPRWNAGATSFPGEALIDEGTKNLGPFYANSADEAVFFSVVATQRFNVFGSHKSSQEFPNLFPSNP